VSVHPSLGDLQTTFVFTHANQIAALETVAYSECGKGIQGLWGPEAKSKVPQKLKLIC